MLRNTGTNEVLADLLIPYDASANGPIAAGGAAARQAAVVLPDGPRGAGAMSVTLTLDAANDVAETNAQGTAELNNVASLSFSSALAPYPDLVVTDVAVLPGVGWLPGDSVTVTWVTRNQGDGPASGTWDETVRIRNDGTERFPNVETSHQGVSREPKFNGRRFVEALLVDPHRVHRHHGRGAGLREQRWRHGR